MEPPILDITHDNAVLDISNRGIEASDSEEFGGHPPSYYLDRANQTGTQAISTVTGLQADLDAKVAKAGDTMTGPLLIDQNVAGIKARLAMKLPGTQNDAPTTFGVASTYLGVGGGEWNTNSFRLIGFGYIAAVGNQYPAVIGYEETSVSSNTRGDLVFGTRPVNTNVAPSIFMRLKSSGELSLPSINTSGFALYNTTDEVTNYERARLVWSSNVLNIFTESGGTGVSRSILLSAFGAGSQSSLRINNSSSSGFVQSSGASSTASAIIHYVNGTLSSTTGLQYGLQVNPTIGQGTTAGYTGLLVNAIESSVGSGAKLLADFQVGGASRLSISNTGTLTAQEAVVARGNYTAAPSVAGVYIGIPTGLNPRFTLSNGTAAQVLAVDNENGTMRFLHSGVGAIMATLSQARFYLNNTTAAPVDNPANGGYLYVEAGALKYRGSGGTVTPLGPA